jgi:hypothetical protein
MNNIVLKTAIALTLGLPTAMALAQQEVPLKPPVQTEGKAPADAGANGQGGASQDSQKAPTGADKQTQGTQGQDPVGQRSSEPETKPAEQTDKPNPGQPMKKGDPTADTSAPAADDQSTGQQQETAPSGEKTQENTAPSSTDSAPNAQSQQESTTKEAPDTSTQATTGSVNVTAEQKTEIKQIVTETRVEPVRDIDFEVNVGVSVPRTIELQPLPPRIVKIVPGYEGYRYFMLADGRIIIVDPDSFEIVFIIA